MTSSEMTYREKTDVAIRNLISKFECQPILFVGSGLSQRYIQAPTWQNLLKAMFQVLPNGNEQFQYYSQKLEFNQIEIGSKLADLVFEWAWKDGKSLFPQRFFLSKTQKDTFLKYLVCKHLEILTNLNKNPEGVLGEEISSLSKIKPHAIITTNYDLFLEDIFQGYQTITGQTIFRTNTSSFGEIFHIHGDISQPDSIVLTSKDYDDWDAKKRYISAKLLTYFAEHPIFIMGYSLGDPNVRSILRDIGEMVSSEDGLIPNVYQIIWRKEALESVPPEQASFEVDQKEYRTMAIHTNDLKWVYDAISSQSALTSINPKLVRALAARTTRLIRHDIPSGNVTVDYDVLERVANDSSELPKLLGISVVENPNQSHPLTITQVAQRLGFNNWVPADRLLKKIKEEKGVDLKASDNRYHCRIKTGTSIKSATRKWSHEAVDLLKKVKNGRPYEVNT